MPALRNPRHERFCQLYVSGKSGAEALRLSGYVDNWKNVYQLKSRKGVMARISELQDKAARKAEITRDSLVEEFRWARDQAAAKGDWNAVNNAIKGRAVLSGHWVQRTEHGEAGEFAQLSDDELKDRLASEIADLARGAMPDPASGTEH